MEMFDDARDNLAALELAETIELTPELWAQTVAEAATMGADDGKAAATWVYDGSTNDETWRILRTMIDEGDPALWEHYRSPLSGEYADDMTPDALMDELGIVARTASNEERDELCRAYENAHSDAWAIEVWRAVAAYFADQA